MQFIFSEISTSGRFPENPDPKLVLADALNDWGCVMMGAKPPQNFGAGMAKVSLFLGCPATPDGLMGFADKNFPSQTPETEK